MKNINKKRKHRVSIFTKKVFFFFRKWKTPCRNARNTYSHIDAITVVELLLFHHTHGVFSSSKIQVEWNESSCVLLVTFFWSSHWIFIKKKKSRAHDVWVPYAREWVRAREKMKKEKILDDHILVSCCLHTLNEQHCRTFVAAENARSLR